MTPLRLISSRFSSRTAGTIPVQGVGSGQSAAHRKARLIEREPLQRAAQLIENRFSGSTPRAARHPLEFVPQESPQALRSGGRSSDESNATRDFVRNEAHRRSDDHELLSGRDSS